MKEIAAKNGGVFMTAEKGDVLNPKGKPKGTKSFKTILKKFLSQEIDLDDFNTQTKLRLTKKQAMSFLLIRDAINPDEDPNVRMKATQMVMNRVEGEPDKPITVKDTRLKNDVVRPTQEQIDSIVAAFATSSTDNDSSEVPDTSSE